MGFSRDNLLSYLFYASLYALALPTVIRGGGTEGEGIDAGLLG
jgi:hypothetical protein